MPPLQKYRKLFSVIGIISIKCQARTPDTTCEHIKKAENLSFSAYKITWIRESIVLDFAHTVGASPDYEYIIQDKGDCCYDTDTTE